MYELYALIAVCIFAVCVLTQAVWNITAAIFYLLISCVIAAGTAFIYLLLRG